VVDERIRQAVALRSRLAGVLGALGRMAEPSVTEILRLIEETITMNQPLTPEQFAELKEQQARQLREMSAEEFAALKQKREQAWAALSREEQARLLEQRLADGPADRLIAGRCWPTLAGHRSKCEAGSDLRVVHGIGIAQWPAASAQVG